MHPLRRQPALESGTCWRVNRGCWPGGGCGSSSREPESSAYPADKYRGGTNALDYRKAERPTWKKPLSLPGPVRWLLSDWTLFKV